MSVEVWEWMDNLTPQFLMNVITFHAAINVNPYM